MDQMESPKQFSYGGLAAAILLTIVSQKTFAMHIMGSFSSSMWALTQQLLFLPCLWCGLMRLRRIIQEENNQKMLLALYGTFTSVLSVPKIPSMAGSCSHPTDAGLAVILSRPDMVMVLGAVVLLFRAPLLTRSGLTTLDTSGASMAVIGPIVGYLVWKLAYRAGTRRDIGVFLCIILTGLMAYFVTSARLGVAFPGPATGTDGSILKFVGIFYLTQIPIAIAKGLLTVMVYDQLTKRRLVATEGY